MWSPVRKCAWKTHPDPWSSVVCKWPGSSWGPKWRGRERERRRTCASRTVCRGTHHVCLHLTKNWLTKAMPTRLRSKPEKCRRRNSSSDVFENGQHTFFYWNAYWDAVQQMFCVCFSESSFYRLWWPRIILSPRSSVRWVSSHLN